jgi:hypothetical protein
MSKQHRVVQKKLVCLIFLNTTIGLRYIAFTIEERDATIKYTVARENIPGL